ncbi:MAG: hypothetical protein CMJ18_13010 [Phycisphaeraceae bacterium]|nr:hypothetical protein [Phycisphaeraceae bacterium]
MRPLLLLAIAFISGTAALVYETIWLRWFGLLFGNTAHAASATLCAFFAGLALGAALFGRWAGRTRNPLMLYAGIELAAAVASLIVPLAIRLYDPIYAGLYERFADQGSVFVSIKFALALAAVLPTATLLGGTLPPLAAAMVRDPARFGRQGSMLYALNVLGAAFGAAAASLWLPERIGVHGTYGVGIAMSVVAGIVAVVASRLRGGEMAPAAATAPADDAPSSVAPTTLLLLAFVSGLGTLAFEVLLMHGLAQVLDNSVYSFGAVLVVVLVALAVGAALTALPIPKSIVAPLLGWVLVFVAFVMMLIPGGIILATDDLHRLINGTFVNGLMLATAFGGPALLLGGLVLPMTFRLARLRGAESGDAASGSAVGPRLGGLLAFNTVGGIIGSVGAGFFMLDWLGLWWSLYVLAVFYAVASVLVSMRGWMAPARVALAAVALTAVLFSPWAPGDLPVVKMSPGDRLLDVRAGASGVVTVVDQVNGSRAMMVDNNYILSESGARILDERTGHLPLLLHPEPRNVLFIGSATGATASAAVPHPVEQIVMVEIVPQVHELAKKHFAEKNRSVHTDPRARLVTEDGRNHLRAVNEKYDVIVADLFVPWRRGVGALYTVEHFQAARAHLTEQGLFCQWLPMYQLSQREFRIIAATFLEVFPDATLWRGAFVAQSPTAALIGTLGDPPKAADVDRRTTKLSSLDIDDRWVTDASGVWTLYIGPLATLHHELKDFVPNRDDRPYFEFVAGRTSNSERKAFINDQWPAMAQRVFEASGSPIAEATGIAAGISGNRRRLAEAGLLFCRASLLSMENRKSELEDALDGVRSRLPRHLLSPRDNTITDVWP